MKYNDSCIRGRVSHEWLEAHKKNKFELVSMTPVDRRLVLVCGSNEFNEQMKCMVMEHLGISEQNIVLFIWNWQMIFYRIKKMP